VYGSDAATSRPPPSYNTAHRFRKITQQQQQHAGNVLILNSWIQILPRI